MSPLAIQPADIVAVRSHGLAGALIRFGEGLEGEPNIDAHVAVMHHWTGPVPWFIQGEPGGVSWRDGRDYLASGWTVSNVDQPKTAVQRQLVCDAMAATIGTPYDWGAIAADAADALDLPHLWESDRWGPGVPGHVVCSSVAAWAYAKALLRHPLEHPLPETTPGDWTEFCLTRAWLAPPPKGS